MYICNHVFIYIYTYIHRYMNSIYVYSDWFIHSLTHSFVHSFIATLYITTIKQCGTIGQATGTQDLFVPRPAVRKLWQSRVTCALKELHRLENQRAKANAKLKKAHGLLPSPKRKGKLIGSKKNAAYIITNGKYISESSFKKNDTAESLKK